MSESNSNDFKKRVVTIREVAQLAGVSQMTVSRVLNQKAIVKVGTRAKVESAMAELNYRPNLLARGLAGGKSVFIGLLYFNPSYGYLNELLVGALDACRELGHHLVVENFATSTFQPHSADQPIADIARRLRAIGLDGVIVAPPLSENANVLSALREVGVPFVRVSHGDLNCNDLSVVINDSLAASDMTELLIANGHKKIAFIMGAQNHSSSAQRLVGFKSALGRHGLALQSNYLQRGDYTFASGFKAAEALLALSPRPTAIFASNDEMAAGVIAASHMLRISVPQELTVVGYDDTAMATSTWPTLTTVHQPVGDMARQAVTLLAKTLSANQLDDAERLQILEHSIVKRDSVALAPKVKSAARSITAKKA